MLVHASIFPYMLVHACTCLYMLVRYMPVHAFTCQYIPLHACTCSVYMLVHACTCQYIPVHACTCLYMPVHSCTCLYMHVYLPVHAWLWLHHWSTCRCATTHTRQHYSYPSLSEFSLWKWTWHLFQSTEKTPLPICTPIIRLKEAALSSVNCIYSIQSKDSVFHEKH